MRKHLLLMLAFFTLFLDVNAANVKTVRLSFNKQQFSFENDEAGALKVSGDALLAGYDSDTSMPGLPLVAVNVGLHDGETFAGVDNSITKQLLYENVVVAANPVSLPTNYDGELPKPTIPVYAQNVYPNENVRYVCTSKMDGYIILRFLVCPFEYDVQSKKLYLATSITLNINLADSPSFLSVNEFQGGQNLNEIFKSQIVNPEDFEESQIAAQSFDIQPGIGAEIDSNHFITERYLIVTSQALAPYFEPLVAWKMKKGFKARVESVENITAQHPEMDTQLAIKTYLYDEYKNNKLKYVLLGGSDFVVPSRKCYQYFTNLVDSVIPSDLYYACFDGNFSWDGNGNGRYGEVEDSVSMEPNIIVTRATVRKDKDVKTFVNKVLGYEQYPNKNGWNNNILMAGVKLGSIWKGHSDSERAGESIYENNIVPYWNGTRFRFYDTCTDFPGGANYDVNLDNLHYQLSQGYTFVDMITHGNRDHWSIEEKDTIYTTSDAHFQINNNYSIITTIACITNAFDTTSKSLSEEFLTNAQSGVVAYLGCSREGWTNTSPLYDGAFYRKLFSNEMVNHKFGEVVAAAKSSRLSYCTKSKFDYDRFIQVGLNPLGDPEMPIYTDYPKNFDNVSIEFSSDKKSIIVDTGVDSCSICFKKVADNSNNYALRNVRKARYEITEPTSICITKQNYVPYVTSRNAPFIRPIITKCEVNSSEKTAVVSTQLDENANNARVVVASAIGNAKAECQVSAESPTVVVDLSKFADGVQTVTLFVDGKNVDSRNILKK